MHILTLFILLLALSFNANADFKDWAKKDKEILIAHTALTVVDVAQTLTFVQTPCINTDICFKEINPILGKQPSYLKVVGVNLLASYLLYEFIDKRTPLSNKARRNLWYVNALRFSVVAHNHHIGIRVNIKL